MGKRKVPVVRTYHIKYTCDVIVQATSTKEAYTKSDLFMYDQLENPEFGLENVFDITLESNHFNIVPAEYFDNIADEDDDEDDENISDEEDDDLEDDEEYEDDDEDEDEDDDEEE